MPRVPDSQEVVYLDPSSGEKVLLGPVIITGANVDRASAALIGGTQTRPVVEWVVTFELDAEGADAFAAATTTAVSAPPPQNQIAIVVDAKIISNPVVQIAITERHRRDQRKLQRAGGAKDLATDPERRVAPGEPHAAVGPHREPHAGHESLRQGMTAGSAGLILLFLYLLLYYRLLGVVAWFGMSIWAILAMALDLAGGRRSSAMRSPSPASRDW